MTGWRYARLGDLCKHVTVGHVGRMIDEYCDEGVIFLRSQDVRPFSLEVDRALRINAAFHKKLRKSSLQSGDVVVVRTGYPGTAAVVPANVEEANCADLIIVRPGPALDPTFVAAWFNSTIGRSIVAGQLVGSAQQHFNVRVAADLKVRLPDRLTQSRVGAVLDVFSQLIKNNRRRIETLEEAARSLYGEWFLRYRFPGHESSGFSDSPIGSVPTTWTVEELRSRVEINPSSVNPSMWEEVRYLDISAVGDRSLTWPVKIPGPEAPGRARRLVQDGDVVHSMVRPSRRAHALIVDPPSSAVASTGLAVLRSRGVPAAFLFELISDTAFTEYLVGRATGAAYPAVKPRDFAEAVVVFPPSDILEEFASRVEPLHRLATSLSNENVGLGAARDVLLPRIVSGNIGLDSLCVDDVFGWAELAGS